MGLPEHRVGLLTPHEPSGLPPDPSWTSELAPRPLPDLWVSLPDLRVGHPIFTGPLGGLPNPSRTSEWTTILLGWPPDPFRTFGWSSRPLETSAWVFRPIPDLRVGLPTPPGPLGVTPEPARTSGWTSLPLPNLWV